MSRRRRHARSLRTSASFLAACARSVASRSASTAARRCASSRLRRREARAPGALPRRVHRAVDRPGRQELRRRRRALRRGRTARGALRAQVGCAARPGHRRGGRGGAGALRRRRGAVARPSGAAARGRRRRRCRRGGRSGCGGASLASKRARAARFCARGAHNSAQVRSFKPAADTAGRRSAASSHDQTHRDPCACPCCTPTDYVAARRGFRDPPRTTQ